MVAFDWQGMTSY